MPGGGARSQKPDYQDVFFVSFFFLYGIKFVFEQQVLFRVDSLCDFQP